MLKSLEVISIHAINDHDSKLRGAYGCFPLFQFNRANRVGLPSGKHNRSKSFGDALKVCFYFIFLYIQYS